MTTLRDFPGAPADAEITEEGWLVTGQEAWTVEEWATTPHDDRPRTTATRANRYATEEERRAAMRASRNRWNERNRADPAYRAHEAELRRRRSTLINPSPTA